MSIEFDAGYDAGLGASRAELARLRAENEALRADAERWHSLRKWDGQPFAATDTVWVEAGREEK